MCGRCDIEPKSQWIGIGLQRLWVLIESWERQSRVMVVSSLFIRNPDSQTQNILQLSLVLLRVGQVLAVRKLCLYCFLHPRAPEPPLF